MFTIPTFSRNSNDIRARKGPYRNFFIYNEADDPNWEAFSYPTDPLLGLSLENDKPRSRNRWKEVRDSREDRKELALRNPSRSPFPGLGY